MRIVRSKVCWHTLEEGVVWGGVAGRAEGVEEVQVAVDEET